MKAEDSAGTIFTLFNSVDDPYLKADCLVALGQIRAIELVPQISIILRNLNLDTYSDKQAAEIIAFGAIISLGKMKDTAGFEQVFYASLGWYSRRIKDKATEVLSIISDDPTEPVLKILNGESDFVSKALALNIENRSSASPENKSKAAVLGIKEGLRYSPRDPAEATQLSKLRLAGINILINNNYKNSDIVDDLSTVFTEATDINEKLLSLQALGVNGTDEAVSWLSNQLSVYNERQLSGLGVNQTELIYVKQLISSLAKSGNANAKPVLLAVQFSDYTPAINRLSKNALKELE